MTEKPIIYILHGDEQFAIKNHLDDMISRLGDPVMADLNTTRLDGRSASDEELRTATATMPFLAERANCDERQATLERSMKEAHAETAKAKGMVKEAMGDLERISLDIQSGKE